MSSPEQLTINALSKNSIFRLLYQLMSTVSSDVIVIPDTYPIQVEETKALLENDRSGIVNTMLDFAIDASLVNYTIETGNATLNKILNNWLQSINSSLRGKIPVGIRALAKQYGRERWKGSSLCLLRSLWTEETIGKEKYFLPTKLWYPDGEFIIVEEMDAEKVIIGNQQYYLQTGKDRDNDEDRIELPSYISKSVTEEIFVSKPFSSWSTLYPVPYLIQKGLFQNLKMLELIENKSEKMVSKALEYLAMIKKGTERLFIEKNISYNSTQLTDIKNKFQEMVNDNTASTGSPLAASQFDTEFDHIIPEYSKILKHELRVTYERNILAGLGLVEVIEGAGVNRKESILSPRPFIAEVENGISDFKMLIRDLVETIKEKNKDKHKKFMNINIEIYSSPVKQFLTKDIRDHIRSAYDRGNLSKETYTELSTSAEYPIEVRRRKREAIDGEDIIMYPHITQNVEKDTNDYTENIPDDKKNIEKKNYQSTLKILGIYEEDLEKSPWDKNKDLPKSLRDKLPSGAQTIFRLAFNSAIEEYNNEQTSFKVAWTAVKRKYKRNSEGQWVKK